jgi:hypothetical protein
VSPNFIEMGNLFIRFADIGREQDVDKRQDNLPGKVEDKKGTSPSTGKNKGKEEKVEEVDDEEDEEEKDEEDEPAEDTDDTMVCRVLTFIKSVLDIIPSQEDEDYEEIDPTAIRSRRTRGVKVDYTSQEALEKAGLQRQDLEEDDD